MKTVVFCVFVSGVVVSAAMSDDFELKELIPEERLSDVTQSKTRGPGPFGYEYWWANRFLSKHQERQDLRGKDVDLVMLGDSITHFWEWHDPEGWKSFTAGKRVLNLGYGGDQIKHLVWRVGRGELEGYRARNVSLMIGTNDNYWPAANPTNVARAIMRLADMIHEKQPQSKILLHAILPRGSSPTSRRHVEPHRRNLVTNALLREYVHGRTNVVFVDICDEFVDANGWVHKDLMADEIHPTHEGYRIWAKALSKLLEEAR